MAIDHMENERNKFDELTKEQFKNWAPRYDSKLPRLAYFGRVYEKAVEMIRDEAKTELRQGARFLDVACGTGEIIFRLAEEFPNAEFVGADFSEEMLLKAGEKTARLKNVKAVQSDARNLPFENESFDIVLCSDALHHFSSPEESLREINRVAKRKGSFFLIDPAYDTLFQKIVVGLFGKVFETAKKYYSQKELAPLLESTGFRADRMFTYHFTNFFVCRK